MKRVLAITVAGLTAASIYAVSAPAGGQAVTPKQLTVLTKRVKKLEGRLRAVEKCALAQAVPVIRYGGGGQGYVYRRPSGTEDLVSALDVADVSTKADGWMLVTTPGCATLINGG